MTAPAYAGDGHSIVTVRDLSPGPGFPFGVLYRAKRVRPMSVWPGITAVSTVQSGPGRAFTRRVKPGLVAIVWLMWHVAVGTSGNMKNRG